MPAARLERESCVVFRTGAQGLFAFRHLRLMAAGGKAWEVAVGSRRRARVTDQRHGTAEKCSRLEREDLAAAVGARRWGRGATWRQRTGKTAVAWVKLGGGAE